MPFKSIDPIYFRGSSSNTGVLKEPFVGPVMELFHENEVEDLEDEAEDAATSPESLTVSSGGSSRSSRESGVESMGDVETGAAGDSAGDTEPQLGPDISVAEAEQDTSHPALDSDTNIPKNNDIDSPFEVFNTVYV